MSSDLEQYKRGLMGRDSAGLYWRMDQNVVPQTFGNYTAALQTNTATFTGSLTSGWAQTSTITIATGSGSATLNAGDVIQIAGVYAVNPQNRQAYGGNKLRNFVVQSTANLTTGGVSVTVSPAIITGGQFQNVTVTSTSTTATVTPFANSGQVSPQNIMLHKNAFTLATADYAANDSSFAKVA